MTSDPATEPKLDEFVGDAEADDSDLDSLGEFLAFLFFCLEAPSRRVFFQSFETQLAHSLLFPPSLFNSNNARSTDEDMGEFEAINKEKNLTVSRWKLVRRLIECF